MKIVEFGDFQGPFDKRAIEQIQQVKTTYPGDVSVTFRNLPLAMHPDAALAARAGIAADLQGKFCEMHDRLFANQVALKRSDLERYAREIGLDVDRFRAALDSVAVKERVDADVAEARRLGVAGTPTFFVNGRPVKGAHALDDFKRVIDDELAKEKARGEEAQRARTPAARARAMTEVSPPKVAAAPEDDEESLLLGVLAARIFAGDAKSVKAMLEEQPELARAVGAGYTTLQMTSANHKVAPQVNATIAGLLLAAGADPNALGDGKGDAPLMSAVVLRNEPLVKVLLGHGANPNVRSSDSTTPFLYAVSVADSDMVSLFLDNKPDLELRLGKTDQAGYSAVHIAASYPKAASVLEMLLNAGADVNAQVSDGPRKGATAAHLAVDGNLQPEIIQILKRHHIDLRASWQGQTAYQLAKTKGRTRLVRLLDPDSP